jgi:hypothetical protein
VFPSRLVRDDVILSTCQEITKKRMLLGVGLRFLGSKNPCCICMFFARREHPSLLKQSAGDVIHICVQTLCDVRYFPSLFRKTGPPKSALHFQALFFKQGGYLYGHSLTQRFKLRASGKFGS